MTVQLALLYNNYIGNNCIPSLNSYMIDRLGIFQLNNKSLYTMKNGSEWR